MIQSQTKRTQCIWKTNTTPDRAHKNQLQSKKDAKTFSLEVQIASIFSLKYF